MRSTLRFVRVDYAVQQCPNLRLLDVQQVVGHVGANAGSVEIKYDALSHLTEVSNRLSHVTGRPVFFAIRVTQSVLGARGVSDQVVVGPYVLFIVRRTGRARENLLLIISREGRMHETRCSLAGAWRNVIIRLTRTRTRTRARTRTRIGPIRKTVKRCSTRCLHGTAILAAGGRLTGFVLDQSEILERWGEHWRLRVGPVGSSIRSLPLENNRIRHP